MMNKFRLPEKTTPEDLECGWSKVLTFGDKVVVAGHYYQGPGMPSYYGAVYSFLKEDHDCDSEILLENISDEFFEDDGHAIAWALGM